MQVNFDFSLLSNKRVGVAVSGGSDSMALLHYLRANSSSFSFEIIAINVEHGIRGEASKNDSNFVRDYCAKENIPLLAYCVDSIALSKQNKLSLEEAARLLRYDCFFSALSQKKCDVIATAHHIKDNAETVLFNLFRGTGLNGICGIKAYENKIIRPFISVTKQEIENYLATNSIPYVTDQTNFDQKYSRNFIRINILPEIIKAFPDAEKSIYRLSEICALDEDFLEKEADKKLTLKKEIVEISLPLHKALMSRCVITALKHLGVKKDWQKSHIDACYALAENCTGKSVNLLNGVVAIKEYDKLIITKKKDNEEVNIPFSIGSHNFKGKTIVAERLNTLPSDLKSGLYLDLDKIPASAVIRTKRVGDIFKKHGGKTKSLADYLTDIKYPLKDRDNLALIADGNIVLAIFDLATSDQTKIDSQTKNFIKIYQK